jgi:hypothetical protein
LLTIPGLELRSICSPVCGQGDIQCGDERHYLMMMHPRWSRWQNTRMTMQSFCNEGRRKRDGDCDAGRMGSVKLAA